MNCRKKQRIPRQIFRNMIINQIKEIRYYSSRDIGMGIKQTLLYLYL